MKHLSKLLALLLVACMCLTLLAACAKEEKPAEPNTPDAAGTPGAPEEPASPDEPATPEEPEGDDEGDIVDITMAILDMKGTNGEVHEKIENAINAIAGPEIGVNVHIKFIGVGEYPTQISLMISGGEVLDLVNIVPLGGIYFNDMYANGQLMDISSYLAEDYAADLMALMGDYIGAYSFGGKTYGVPTYRIYTTDMYLIMRKDILEDLGMVEAAQNAATLTEFEAIFDAVRDNTDLYPLGGMRNIAPVTSYYCLASENKADAIVWDNLGDNQALLFVDNDGNISNAYCHEAFKTQCERVVEWDQKGYIWPDTLTNNEHTDTIMKQNLIFAKYDGSEFGVETAKKESTGYDVVANNVAPGMVTNSLLIAFGIGVPVTAEEPEAAVKFMDLMYKNAEIMDILTWGIDGEDYVRLDSGEITYPDGLDPNSVEYHNADYLIGNQFLDSPWVGNGGDFRARALEVNDKAAISPYLGFTIDVSGLANEIAGISATIDEFRPALTCGQYTEALYQDFLEKLDIAGAQTYIDTCQQQLTDWISNR